jgi:acyl-CoA thioester hydrolase
MPFVWPVRVRFVDTDASQRIHFTAMLRHFEAAEIEFLRSLGLIHKDATANAVNFPRVNVECTYTAMVQYDDLLNVAVRVERVGNASYKLAFEATVEERLVARGFVTAVCVDVTTGRSRALPPELTEALTRSRKAEREQDAR